MSDNREVLSAIGSLTKLVETKHTALEKQLDLSQKDIARNQKSIDKLFTLDRKQTDEISAVDKARAKGEHNAAEERGKIREEMQPAINSAKSMKKGIWLVIGSALATIGTTIGLAVAKVFERGGA